MKFSSYLWQQISPIYQKILSNPFCLELASGQLSRERFHFYIEQDAHYLMHYARALALIAGRSQTPRLIDTFLNFALDAIEAKRRLDAHFLPEGYSNHSFSLSHTCMVYPRYLIATATTASFEEAIASVVPCLWLYREVGQHVGNQMKEDNPYLSWRSTYSGQKYIEDTDKLIAILDEIAEGSSEGMRNRMAEIFKDCSEFEWQFWNDAYYMQYFQKKILDNCAA